MHHYEGRVVFSFVTVLVISPAYIGLPWPPLRAKDFTIYILTMHCAFEAGLKHHTDPVTETRSDIMNLRLRIKDLFAVF